MNTILWSGAAALIVMILAGASKRNRSHRLTAIGKSKKK